MALVPVLRVVCFEFGWGKGSLDWYTWFVADGLATGSFVAVSLRIRESQQFARKLCTWLLISARLWDWRAILLELQPANGAGSSASADNNQSVLRWGSIALSPHWNQPPPSLREQLYSPVLRIHQYGLYLDHLLAFRIYDRVIRAYWPSLLPSSYHFGLVLLKFAVAGAVPWERPTFHGDTRGTISPIQGQNRLEPGCSA